MIVILLQNPVHPSTGLRANGEEVDNVENFPFMLSLSKHSWGFSAESIVMGDPMADP